MSKYVKLDDVLKSLISKSYSGYKSEYLRDYYNKLPTVEIKEGEMNDFHDNQTLNDYLSKFNISPLDSDGKFKYTETLLKEISKAWENLTY